MKFILAITAMAFALTACNVQEEEKKEDQDGNAMVNQTDYSACKAGSGSPSSPMGTWRMVQAQGSFSFVKTYNIGADYMQVTHDCNFNGAKTSVTVGSKASINFGQIIVMNDQRNEKSVVREGYKLTCQAEVTGGTSLYYFQGGCLVLTDDAGKNGIMLAPVKTSADF
jgi:hypothetical protein